MKILNLIQGTDAWHLHRATHLNASDAPAMLGVSTYKTRDQLIREKATGVTPEVDSATQQRFDDGHRFEALARPLAEAIVGEDLFPCVGEAGKFSASFDGLTMLGDTAFEHKSLNDKLRAAIRQQGGNANEFLPELYLVQMEHQCMVSGAERALFMASKWAGDELVEERHCWYTADEERRSRIVAGWDQFEADVTAYQPADSAPPVVLAGRAPEQLPALRVEVTGMVTASNLAEFKTNAMTVLGNINRDLQTDEDFANADKTVKWCKDVEERLDLTKQQVLDQTADIAAVFRTMDEVADETRRVRLELDRLVKNEKERRRGEIVSEGVAAVRAHYETINGTLGQHALHVPASIQSVVGEAIKGKKTIASIREAANGAAANLKIAASQTAERVRTNAAILAEYPDQAHLFADRVQLCAAKEPADLRNLALARIAEHRQQQEAREAADRERIRQEEVAKLERERAAEERERAAAAERDRLAAESEEAERARAAEPATPVVEAEAVPAPAPAPVSHTAPRAVESTLPFDASPAPSTGPRKTIKLGEINARISPLTITADGLASIGFQPVSTDRGAKLYDEASLVAIYRGLWQVIKNAANDLQQAA